MPISPKHPPVLSYGSAFRKQDKKPKNNQTHTVRASVVNSPTVLYGVLGDPEDDSVRWSDIRKNIENNRRGKTGAERRITWENQRSERVSEM